MNKSVKQLYKKPYLYIMIGIFIIYLTLNVIISQFYITIKFIPYYLDIINWPVLLLSVIFSITIASLVAVNGTFAYLKYKQRQNIKKQSAVASIGTLGGFATGICSACLTGVIPLIFSFFGVTLSFASLPFQGLEIQALIIAVLGINLYFLSKGDSHQKAQ